MDQLHTLDLMISPLTLCWHGYSLLSFPSYMTRYSYKEHSPRLSNYLIIVLSFYSLYEARWAKPNTYKVSSNLKIEVHIPSIRMFLCIT
jgi:hypothetical protein